MGNDHSIEKSKQKKALILEQKFKESYDEENRDSIDPLKKDILTFFQWEQEPKKIKHDICHLFTFCTPIEARKVQKTWRKNLITQYKSKIKANKKKFKWARRLCSILKASSKNDEDYQKELPLILLKSYNSSSPASNLTIYSSCDMNFIDTPLASTYFDSIPWCPSGDQDFVAPLFSSIEIIKKYDHGSLLEEVHEGRNKFIYKAIINMIEKHLKDEHNTLNMLMKTFEKDFLEKNKAQLQENIANDVQIDQNGAITNKDQLTKKETTEDYNPKPINPPRSKSLLEMYEEVKGFLEFMRDAILEFYEIETLEQKIETIFRIEIEFFSLDNLMNFITSFFFHTFEVYNFLFKLQAANDSADEALLRSKFQSLKKWKPADFLIKEALRLDESTIDYIKKKNSTTASHVEYFFDENELGDKWRERGEFIQKSKPQEEDNVLEERHNSLKYFFPAKSSKILMKMCAKENRRRRISSADCDQPYGKVIKKLEIFSQFKSPVHQLKALGEAFKLMIESVDEFHRKSGGLREKIILETDDLICILMYVISRVKPQRILSHIKFIRFFITDRYIYDVVGYQLTTLEACVETIKMTDVKEEKTKFMNMVKASVLNEVGMEDRKTFMRKGSF